MKMNYSVSNEVRNRVILVFGGSFDPPHRGHVALLEAAARRIRPDIILVLPAYHAPLKSAPSAPARDRLRMLRLGLPPALSPTWRKRCRIDSREIDLGRRVYTVESLRRISRGFPKAELHFVVGSDAAATFESWKDPSHLKILCVWWTAPRPVMPDAARSAASRRPPAHFNMLAGPMPPVSSSEIRRALSLGEDASPWVAPAVLAYIRRRGLYGTELLRALREGLNPERFEHTLAVARFAEELANRWGQDPTKARLAGLLHDCGRSIPVPAMARYARRRHLRVPSSSAIARHHPILFHAYIGEDMARRRFGVRDPEVLSAIRKHTLGGRRMSALDRVLYVADAASPDRTYAAARDLRRLALTDINAAFKKCVLNKLAQVRRDGGSWLHPMTSSLWDTIK